MKKGFLSAKEIVMIWGERCPDTDVECFVCKAWVRHDMLQMMKVEDEATRAEYEEDLRIMEEKREPSKTGIVLDLVGTTDTGLVVAPMEPPDLTGVSSVRDMFIRMGADMGIPDDGFADAAQRVMSKLGSGD